MGNKFKEGDIVQLKSGGPNMTIGQYIPNKQQYLCNWFKGDEMKGGFFNEAALKLIAESE